MILYLSCKHYLCLPSQNNFFIGWKYAKNSKKDLYSWFRHLFDMLGKGTRVISDPLESSGSDERGSPLTCWSFKLKWCSRCNAWYCFSNRDFCSWDRRDRKFWEQYSTCTRMYTQIPSHKHLLSLKSLDSWQESRSWLSRPRYMSTQCWCYSLIFNFNSN